MSQRGRKPKPDRTAAEKAHAEAERKRYQNMSPAQKRDLVRSRDREAQQAADARRHERDRDDRNAKQREYNRKNWDDHAPQRKARALASMLPKPAKCQRCGGKGKQIEAHHPDHSKPRNVVFLCSTCHGGEHQDG